LLYDIYASGEAKPKISFPFFVGSPPHPAEEKKKGKENFWFLLPRPQGADEARRLVISRIVLEKSSDFVQETQLAVKKHLKSVLFQLRKGKIKI